MYSSDNAVQVSARLDVTELVLFPHSFNKNLHRIVAVNFPPDDLIFLSSVCARRFFFCLNRFAIPHQLITGKLDRSVHRSLVPSAAHSIARSLGRSFGRSVSRSVHLPLSLSPSPYLVFPYPFPCISHPSPPQSGFVDWNKTFHSHAHCA